MRKFFVLLLLYLVLIACQNNGQKPLPPNKYEVIGHIDGLSEDMRLIVSDISTKDIVPLYEVKVKKDDKFLFRGDLDKTTPYYLTLIRESDSTFAPADNLVVFFEPTRITIEAEADKLAEAKITGSRAHNHFEIYRKNIAPYEQQAATLNREAMQSTVEKDTIKYHKTMQEFDKVYRQWVAFNKKFLLEDSLDYTVRSFLAANYMLDEEYLNELQQFLKAGTPTIWNKQLLSFIRQMENVAVGSSAPAINSLVDSKLKPVEWNALDSPSLLTLFFWIKIPKNRVYCVKKSFQNKGKRI